MTLGCPECGHEHAGPDLGGICIGCPCTNREHPVARRDRADLAALKDRVDGLDYPNVHDILAEAWSLGWRTGWDDHAAGAGSLARPRPTITRNPFDHPATPIPPQGR